MITIKLPHSLRYPILALGADTKGAFAFGKGKEAFLVNGFGDLSDIDNYSRYERAIKTRIARHKIIPKKIACDSHPGCFSTRVGTDTFFAKKVSVPTLVQHHAAHVAAAIVDNSIKGEVIGVAFDGTGYGLDGNIWGGEFFIGSIRDLRRIAHFKYIPMPGGEAAVREPWRMAYSYLYDAYGASLARATGTAFRLSQICIRHANLLRRNFDIKLNPHRLLGFQFYPISPRGVKISQQSLQAVPVARAKRVGWNSLLIKKMIDNSINSPLTSSVGRLFDGVGSMILSKGTAEFEAEIPMELERIAFKEDCQDTYDFNISREGDKYIIDPSNIIKGVVHDLSAGVKTSVISAKFHNSIAKTVLKTSEILRKRFRFKNIVLTGGVFQNAYLVEKARRYLLNKGFKVFSQNSVPINDLGIAIGQLALASHKRKICV